MNSLAEMNMLRREWGVERAFVREQLERLPEQIETAKDNLAKAQADNIGAKKVATMEELPFDNKRLHAEINRAVASMKQKGVASEIEVGTVGGFNVSVKAFEEVRANFSLLDTTTELAVRIVVQGEATYFCEAGRNETDNNVVRLKNVFASIIPKREETSAEELTRLTENFEQAKLQADVPFEYEDKIAELTKELEILDARLSGITKQEDVIANDDDLEQGETEAEKSKTANNTDTDDDEPPTPPTPDGAAEIPRRGRAA
jgi:hypothetical protein